jgi:hypothetical protein
MVRHDVLAKISQTLGPLTAGGPLQAIRGVAS